MNKFRALTGFTLFAILGSGALVTSGVQAQSDASCNWFTGVYVDQGKGVICNGAIFSLVRPVELGVI